MDTAAIPRTAVPILFAKVQPPALRRHSLQGRLCQQYAIGAIGAEVLVMDGKKKTNKYRHSFFACIGVDILWRNNTLSSPSLEESYTAVIVSRPSDENETSLVKIRGIVFKKVRGLSRPSDKNETSVVKIRGIF
jgi:hypothetical protein